MALLRVANRSFERRPPHPDRPCRAVDASGFERGQDDVMSVTESFWAPWQAVAGPAMSLVGHLDGLDALVSELADVAAHRDAARLHGIRLLLVYEARDAFVGARRKLDEPRALAVR